MKANSDKSKQSNKATRHVLAGVLCGASVLSLVLSLVMPPISQAIANDDQTGAAVETVADKNAGAGENVLGEEAGADNSTGKDAENQKSNDAEGGETSGDAATVGLPSDDACAKSAEQPVDDGANDENDVMPTAADGFTLLNQNSIHNQFGNGGTPGNYRLTEDLEYADTITFDHGETVIDLNGHKITHTSDNQSLFNITGGATLTVMDSQQATVDNPTASNFECSNSTLSKNANLASVVCDETSKIPDKLIYYVTGSSVNEGGTSTTEALYRHEVTIGGAIVACNSSNRVSLINLFGTNGKGGTFNLQSGVLTQEENCNVAHLIYAQNGSTVNMSGGYVCGASVGRDGAGAGIAAMDNSTLEISDGVIAGNYAPSGGGVYALNSTVNMVGGIISGNGTNNYESGYGAGICAEDSMVTITNGYITNNKYQFYTDEGHKGNGCHGGGGIAAFSHNEGQKNGSLVISGGYITGNYSAEAGGGVYAGAWNRALSRFTFSGGTIASNVAEHSEGGGIRISAPTESVFEVPIDSHADSHAYITNNTTNTSNDWGGGGVFVQGGNGSVQPVSLRISNALITNNHAKGFGGGFAACPTGKTAITDTDGIAIFGNSDENGVKRSGGTHEKTDDKDEKDGGEITEKFKEAGHQDLFLIRDHTNGEYIAAVTGQMLGGGAANWTGTIDKTPTSIGKYEGAQAKYMIGLRSEPIQDDKDAATAAASLFITGNSSNIHGGGIMTNGDVVAGDTTQVSVYPKMKLTGSKALVGRNLKKGEFEFELLKQGSNLQAPSFNDKGALQPNGCRVVDTAQNDTDGSFTFDLGEVYADTNLVYYLVEKPGAEKDITYSKTIYKIEPTVTEDTSKSHDVLNIHYAYYKVDSVKITKTENGKASESTVNGTSNNDVVSIQLTNDTTFTNEYTTYTSSGSWIPAVTKVVEGGEMKKFTLEFADNENFDSAQTVMTDPNGVITTTADGKKSQTRSFDEIEYKLDQLDKLKTDSTGRGASKTFTYYVREKKESSTYPHYKFDQSVYRFNVVATDNTKGGIDCAVTYKKGTVGSDGNWKADVGAEELNLTETSTPTFTNTYSTSLPLSGMSGVTLTYLAGAAVLCAAAAWMHIRRKANAKGGERRE